jgi:hypothetical protein
VIITVDWLANLRFCDSEGITQTLGISNIVAQGGAPEVTYPALTTPPQKF